MKKITSVFIGVFLFISCSNDNEKIKNTEYDLMDRKNEIKEIVKLHSKGLDFFYNKITLNHSLKSNDVSEIGEGNIHLNREYDLVKENVEDFFVENNLDSEHIKNLAVISDNFSLEKSKNLSDYGFEFSKEFYSIALQIINIEGNYLNKIKENQDKILTSASFKNLSNIEKDIILLGAETYIDSYEYWDNNANVWEPEVYSFYSADSKKHEILSKKKGFWNSVKKYAMADGKGAIAGGIGGAVSGAVVGSIAGGVGALPGAGIGAVGGAISGGISNSVLEALSLERPMEKDIKLDNGLFVPEMWNKFVLDDKHVEISKIKFYKNDFILN